MDYKSRHAGRLPASLIQKQLMNMTKDQVKGRVKHREGTVKEAAGKLIGNEKLQHKGAVQKIVGKAQAAIGDTKEELKDAVDKI
jgi:uncharacterized protein YjbJ (UPF0337 family)